MILENDAKLWLESKSLSNFPNTRYSKGTKRLKVFFYWKMSWSCQIYFMFYFSTWLLGLHVFGICPHFQVRKKQSTEFMIQYVRTVNFYNILSFYNIRKVEFTEQCPCNSNKTAN